MNFIGDCMATNVAEIRDQDELEVYGLEDKASVQITSYAFEVSKTSVFWSVTLKNIYLFQGL
jgi:hypothetical protein